MQKLSLCILIMLSFLMISDMALATTQFSSTITRMENSIFGMDYSTQSDQERITRLEENVYGEKSKGNLKTRITKLSADLNADMLGKEIKPKRDTFDEEENSYKEPEVKADSNVNYPIIDKLETKAFNKTFKSTDIEKRLSNLEKKVFSKTYNDDLNSRTDRLKTALLPKNDFTTKSDDLSDYSQDSIDLSEFYKQYNKNNAYNTKEPQNDFNSYETPVDIDVISPLASLEKKILRRSYKNDEVPTRLVRLETKLFNTTFTQDDNQTRLDRISSAYEASKTSKKYDDNKFSQKMSTAMQIGAFLLMVLAVIL